MSGRKLRKGTRKDYRKIADVDDNNNNINNNDDVSESGAVVVDAELNEPTEFNEYLTSASLHEVEEGGNNEQVLSSDENVSGDISEDELERMEEELKVLQLEEKKERRLEKFRRLSKETVKVKGSLKKIRNDKVDIRTLREMDDVVGEVDQLMGKKINRKLPKSKPKNEKELSSESDFKSSESESEDEYEGKSREKRTRNSKKMSKANNRRQSKSTSRSKSKTKFSEDESSNYSSSSNDEDSSSDSDSKSSSGEENEKKKSKNKRRTSQESTRSKKKKKKSGKDLKITSSVKNPQKWPHAYLAQHFVSKNKKFEELSVAEFCAGYATILKKSSRKKQKHRISHLEDLMYLATRYQWRSVLNYHAAVLVEIERGNASWGDSFETLKSTTLISNPITSQRNGTKINRDRQHENNDPSTSKESGSRVLFCRNFQRGTCSHTNDHQGWYDGRDQLLRHICANCWLVSKKMASHPEHSESCPYFEKAG